MKLVILSVCAAAIMSGAMPSTYAGGEIHATVRTADGESLTGSLRWDKNENFWDDKLDAQKEEGVFMEDRSGTFQIFGLQLPRWGSGGQWVHPQFSIPFGHIRTITPGKDNTATLELKSGEVLAVKASSTDLGPSMRGLIIEAGEGGRVELKWDSVRRVEFSQGSAGDRDTRRLYGTVQTRNVKLQGFVVWDRDESLLEDVLDGKNRDGDQEIAFSRIRSIRRDASRGSEIELTDGSTIFLQGSNDVDDGNRGIDVAIPGLGTARVEWEEFVSLTLQPPPASPGYQDFDGGRLLKGELTTTHDTTHVGLIVWDQDEKYTWESLDGRSDGVYYSILFENIRSIQRLSAHAASVQLRDGKALQLEDSNDVDERNKGILVQEPSGNIVQVNWADLHSVDFSLE